jgi:uncharacterized membrane protein SirB2
VKKAGQALSGALLFLVFATYFFMPFSRWNLLASAALLIVHTRYLIAAFRASRRRPKKVQIEMTAYAVILMVVLAVLATKGLPLFAWILIGGSIVNFWVRVFYPK